MPARSRSSATANCRRARSGRRPCSPLITGCPGSPSCWMRTTPRSMARWTASPRSSRWPRNGRRSAGMPSTWTVTTSRRSPPRSRPVTWPPGLRSSSAGPRPGVGWPACRPTPTGTSSSFPPTSPTRPPPNYGRKPPGSPRRRPAMADLARQTVLGPPYGTVLKPYGRALVELARARPEVVCLSGDLTRQCEVDLFQEEFPGRFIHAGMAEANMIGIAGALARQGLMPFVHSFGVFVTRRPLDQIVNAVAYPRLPLDRAQVVGWRGEAMDGGAQTTGGAGTDGGGVTSGGAQFAGGADTNGGAHIAGLADTVGGGVSTGGGVSSGGAHTAGLADTVGGGVSTGGGVSSGGAGITDGGWTSGTA